MEVGMKRPYKNFDELLARNKAIFSSSIKSGHKGILKACWDARDAEFQNLYTEFTKLQKQLKTNDQKNNREKEETIKAQSDLKLHIGELQIERDAFEIELEDTKAYAEELKGYGDEIKTMADYSLSEAKKLDDDLQEERKARNAAESRADAEREERERVEEESKKSLSYVEKLNEYVEKSNAYAEISSAEAKKHKEEAYRIKQLAEQRGEEADQFKANADLLTKRIEELGEVLGSAMKEAEKAKKSYVDSSTREEELRNELKKIQAYCDKLGAEANQATSFSDRLQDNFDELKSDSEQNRIYCEELQSYSNELREEATVAKRNFERSQVNVKRLQEYSEKLKLGFEREKTRHQETVDYVSKCENEIKRLSGEGNNLKCEVARLESIVEKIQTSLSGITNESVKPPKKERHVSEMN